MKPKLALVSTKLQTEPERETGTRLEVMEITPKLLDSWVAPPFQRPLHTNAKVLELAQKVKADQVLPGILTLGVCDKIVYILDGQHRLQAFRLAEIELAYADVRIVHFDNIGEMGQEFVTLNSSLVALRPDDILRGLEPMSPQLAYIRRQCPFAGYDMIRRGTYAPILSMSMVLRSWKQSQGEVPASAQGRSAHVVLSGMTLDDAKGLVRVLQLFYEAWGRDAEYARLWGSLNLTLCMWLYRRVVLDRSLGKVSKVTPEVFMKSVMALSASPHYLEWLVGRTLRETDRSPAYNRMKAIVTRRMAELTGKKIYLPAPAWAHA